VINQSRVGGAPTLETSSVIDLLELDDGLEVPRLDGPPITLGDAEQFDRRGDTSGCTVQQLVDRSHSHLRVLAEEDTRSTFRAGQVDVLDPVWAVVLGADGSLSAVLTVGHGLATGPHSHGDVDEIGVVLLLEDRVTRSKLPLTAPHGSNSQLSNVVNQLVLNLGDVVVHRADSSLSLRLSRRACLASSASASLARSMSSGDAP